MYVEELIGPDTGRHDAEETIMAYQDHGNPEPTARAGPGAGAPRFDEPRMGVDYAGTSATQLEREGVEKFAASFDELLQALDAKRHSLSAAA